jgi:hypothetical protein
MHTHEQHNATPLRPLGSYYDATPTYVPNKVVYGGSTSVAYPYGTSLTDAEILSVVKDALP